MANYKIRQPITLMQELQPVTGLTIGTDHTQSASKMIFGRVNGAVVTSLSGTTGSVVIVASNLAVTDTVIVTPGSMPDKVIFSGASCLVAHSITVKYFNLTVASGTSYPVTFDYLALA